MATYQVLADIVLALHLVLVVFVVGGLVAVLVGRALRWRWFDSPWFRLLHLTAIAVVVFESWAGIACPLTTLEMFLRARAQGATYDGGFVEHWLQRALYFDAPGWVFTLAYSAFGALVLATWWLFPPGSGAGGRGGQAIVSTVPPSTRKAAPVVADACIEQT